MDPTSLRIESDGIPGQAARGVLGAMILDPNALALSLPLLRDDAMVGSEGLVLRAIRALAGRNQSVNSLSVHEQLKRHADLEAAGGAGFISDLTMQACSMSFHEAYIEAVNDAAALRALKLALLELLGKMEDEDPTTLIDMAEERIMAVRDGAVATNATEMLGSILSRVSFGQHGIETGMRPYDRHTGGLIPRQLVVVGARPGVGKTAFGLGIADHLAENKIPTLFFSLEMDRREISERLVAFHGVTLGDVRYGTPRAAEVASQLLTRPLWINDTSSPTVLDIKAAIHRARPKPRVVIVDYLQLVRPLGRHNNRAEAVDGIARALKTMAGQLEVPIIALAQLNRGVEGRGKDARPMLSDLRESGGIENHADVVVLLHRPKLYEAGNTEAELLLAKNRQGPTRGGKLAFLPDHAQFSDLYVEDE